MNEVKSNPYDFAAYQSAKVTVERESARLEAASASLTNAKVRARLAELKSQHEPLNGLLSARVSERERLYAAAFYVVVGRMPGMENDDAS